MLKIKKEAQPRPKLCLEKANMLNFFFDFFTLDMLIKIMLKKLVKFWAW